MRVKPLDLARLSQLRLNLAFAFHTIPLLQGLEILGRPLLDGNNRNQIVLEVVLQRMTMIRPHSKLYLLGRLDDTRMNFVKVTEGVELEIEVLNSKTTMLGFYFVVEADYYVASDLYLFVVDSTIGYLVSSSMVVSYPRTNHLIRSKSY